MVNYYDLRIGSVSGIRDLVEKTERETLYTREDPQELELCQTHEEYTEWMLSKNLKNSLTESVKLSDVCRRKKHV